MNNFKIRLKWVVILFPLSLLISCSAYRPTNTNDLCHIFLGETDWYEAARDAQHRAEGVQIGAFGLVGACAQVVQHHRRDARDDLLHELRNAHQRETEEDRTEEEGADRRTATTTAWPWRRPMPTNWAKPWRNAPP